MIVIYDPLDAETSEGRRPLATRQYYARLTQAMITALTAPMAEGRLYEVDMRLRPSGNQGPVATSWKSFQDYQLNEAWVWEHLALTRARVVTGDMGLARDIEAFRCDVIAKAVEPDKVLAEARNMRRRVADAKQPAGILDAKTGPGRMMDIELLAQAGALVSGQAVRDVPGGLQGAVRCGILKSGAARTLERFYEMYHAVQTASRLLSPQTPALDDLGKTATDMLCRAAGVETPADLVERLEAAYLRATRLVDEAMDADEREQDAKG
jgi:glutamate-ammonia-ligase adenylyltransferase